MKLFIGYFLLVFPTIISSAESECFGTTKNGRLVDGVQLPSSGANFVSYGSLPEIVGRTYVHDKVRDVVIDSYKRLEKEQPDKVFKYAETGFKNGGRFKPHKTHQNGLSIDFIVPVTNEKGKSVHLPTTPLNKYGYNIEFDRKGKYKNFQLDFETLGAHIVALHKAALAHNVDLWRVIFSPDLQQYLHATKYGNYIKKNIRIPTKKSWVRHDEHYHVDFDVSCRGMK